MGRYSFTVRRAFVTVVATFAASLALAGSAGAVVVNMNAIGPSVNAGNPSVAYNAADQSGYYGVAMIQPGLSGVANPRGTLTGSNIPWVTTSGTCQDPWLASGFSILAIGAHNGLCAHQLPGGSYGSVLPSTEMFALTWDPDRLYWQTTHDYVAHFLGNVAAGSGTLSSPFALTGQYGSANGGAANTWRYGGGCTDDGSVGVSCQFTSAQSSSLPAGYDYASGGTQCTGPVGGTNQWAESAGGSWGLGSNVECVTDNQIQTELQRMVPQTQMLSHLVPGFKPLVVVLTPPGVVDCIDAAQQLCSNNGSSSAQFCSYHGQVNVGGTMLPYVVQPWSASWDEDPAKYPGYQNLGCDEPAFDATLKGQAIPIPLPDATTFAQDAGQRLVSPLSQSLLAAQTDPTFTGWYSYTDGSEINDDGCIALPVGLDNVTVGSGQYTLQREFNNGGALVTDPNSPICAPLNTLAATFVAPSTVNQGDEVQLDGSGTASTLQIAPASYVWNFGDGSAPVAGPSVVHTFASAGTYTITLTVTDRGGNKSSYQQSMTVLTTSGQPAPPPGSGGGSGSGGSSGGGVTPPFLVHLLLLPEGMRSMLSRGLLLQVFANQKANGLITVSISRQAAKRVHIRVGHAATVVIGRGTVSQVTSGAVTLDLHLSAKMAAKLRHLRHVTVTVRLALVPAVGHRLAIVVAGRY